MVLKKWTHEEITDMIKKYGEPSDFIVRCTRNLCDAYHFEKKDWERVYGDKKDLCAKVRPWAGWVDGLTDGSVGGLTDRLVGWLVDGWLVDVRLNKWMTDSTHTPIRAP